MRSAVSPNERMLGASHPWSSYLVVPLFALANAGISLTGGDLSAGAQFVMLGVVLALCAGKPIGVIGATVAANLLGDRSFPAALAFGVCNAGEAMLTAFSRADRVTFTGSTMPRSIMFPNSSLAAS